MPKMQKGTGETSRPTKRTASTVTNTMRQIPTSALTEAADSVRRVVSVGQKSKASVNDYREA